MKRESDLLMTSMVTDQIGRHNVLLPINHNHYNFRKTESFNWKKTLNSKLLLQALCLKYDKYNFGKTYTE